MSEFVLCSECFADQGLRLDAERLGAAVDSACPACGAQGGRQLNRERAAQLAHSFFVWGTVERQRFGAAPVVQFNEYQKTDIRPAPWLAADIERFESALGVGFFYYGPRMWMLGEVEPLKALEDPATRGAVVERILREYPAVTLEPGSLFYRIRKGPRTPDDPREYDSGPNPGAGRLDAAGFPVMYASPDLQVCIHECRVAAEDALYVATLSARRALRLLDLTELLPEDGVTEFESLDMAVHMLFLAGEHAYPIARDIAVAARTLGFDGLIYASYFSLLRTGFMPFETAYGLSLRRFQSQAQHEKAKIIPNLAIFGRPIEAQDVEVRCINKVVLTCVDYGVQFGPASVDADDS